MVTLVQKPVSSTKRLASFVALVIAIAVIALNVRAHPEFGPPIIFGFSLAAVGLIGGSLLAIVMVVFRWCRRGGNPG